MFCGQIIENLFIKGEYMRTIDKDGKKSIVTTMISNKREQQRYDDFTRVHITELCSLPGILENISLTGCRIKFPVPFMVHEDKEYKIVVSPVQKTGLMSFTLLGTTKWCCDYKGYTKIGFHFLHSPGLGLLKKYLDMLSACEENLDDLVLEELCLL